MDNILGIVFKFLPLIFAFGFLAPVIAQGIDAAGLVAPFGMSSLLFALIVGGAWGLFAQITGSWL